MSALRMYEGRTIVVGAPRYGGSFTTSESELMLPYVLLGEVVEVSADGAPPQVLQPSAQRVTPACMHFGVCGGCQYQMASDAAQVAIKRTILEELLHASLAVLPSAALPPVVVHAGEPYGYRNRIRLQLRQIDGTFHAGYNRRGTTEFLAVTMCPIAVPALWRVVQALLAVANDAAVRNDRALLHWLQATRELELFSDAAGAKVQLTLFCAPRTSAPKPNQPGHFAMVFAQLQAAMPDGLTLSGAGAAACDPRTGPTGRTLASAGASGLNYSTAAESYWITRGGFFQVNRSLVDTLMQLVCASRSGSLAWDLFAGVGLFSRVLTRSFAQVTAVESNPTAVADLRAYFERNGGGHEAVAMTAQAFLERAVLQRERPELIVLDPPRAGAGVAACALLLRLAPREIVYVSCDPVTLARDLAVLCVGYRVVELHLVDMFPQTYHLETVVILQRIV